MNFRIDDENKLWSDEMYDESTFHILYLVNFYYILLQRLLQQYE